MWGTSGAIGKLSLVWCSEKKQTLALPHILTPIIT